MLSLTEKLTGRCNRLHIVGGGVKSPVLNQFAANATGRTVLAGPVEATACGNLLLQALALGHIASLEEARKIVRASCDIAVYEPQQSAEWNRAFDRFSELRLQR